MATTKRSPPISDSAVEAKTGRDWSAWVKILDSAGAAAMTHAEIARLLATRYRVASWWSQMVTVGYEQLKGRRQRLQKREGYAASASRTIAASLEDVFEAASNVDLHARWLPEGAAVHRTTARKSMRATDVLGRKTISLNFYAKGAERSQVTAQQEKLRSRAEALRLKRTWAASLRSLESLVVAPRRAGKPTASRKQAGRPSRRK